MIKVKSVIFINTNNDRLYTFRISNNEFQVILDNNSEKVVAYGACSDITEDNIDLILKQIIRIIE